MAKQAGAIKFTGTIDDLCFYRMEGEYYVRRKSSLTGKRYQRDAAFERSRKSASRFAEGNRLASKLYKMIPKEKRLYSVFCFLKRKSILLLKEGKHVEEAEALLVNYLIGLGLTATKKVRPVIRKVRITGDIPQLADIPYYTFFTPRKMPLFHARE